MSPRGDLAAAGLALALAMGAGEAEAPPRDDAAAEERIAARDAAASLAGSTIDYPKDGSIFPTDFAAPTVLWHDGGSRADRWAVEWVFGNGGDPLLTPVDAGPPAKGEIDPRCVAVTNELYTPTPYQASALAWRPSREVWATVTRRAAGGAVVATFVGWRAGEASRPLTSGRLRFSVSADPVGAPIFYRDVPLMPSASKDGVIKPLDQSAQPLIQWRLKDVSRDDSRVVMHDIPTCANCHSFPADGKTLAMDVDGPDGDKGAYAIAPIGSKIVIDDDKIMTWNAFNGKPQGHMTLGFLSRISPDGRKVVSTVNERLYVRNFTDFRFLQTFFPTRGILAWYDVAAKTIRALPGADDKRYVHCNPVWRPDGKELVFMRSGARDPYDPAKPVALFAGDPNETQIRFDLYRIPFNDGRGGEPEPIPGASRNGMSNSFPKVSPDGKWLVWTKARNGMLLRPDGRLWIMALPRGTPRLMTCNTPLMNSWHSFSPNGRWLVFSSKANTPYTQLFLTHIDASGEDSPAILIERTQAANRAANIPEFVAASYDGFGEIVVPAVAHRERFYRANDLAEEGRKDEAIDELNKALEGEPKEWRTYDWKYHDKISRLLLEQGRTDEAVEHIRMSIELNPGNPAMHANLGYVLYERGDLAEARKELDTALRLAPADARSWLNRGSVRLAQGDAAGAEGDFTRAAELTTSDARAWSGKGMACWSRGDLPGARAAFDRALALDASDLSAWFFRAKVRRATGDLPGALQDLDRAFALAPPGSAPAAEIEALRRELTRTPSD
jgi:tetratricopeptide (TPR) repeat protein